MREDEEIAARNREILRLRDGGAGWLEITERFGITRQQARYGYQLAKRAERRAGRKGASSES